MSRGSIFAGRAVVIVSAEDHLNKGLTRVRNTLRKFANTLSNVGDSALRGGLLGSILSGVTLKHFVDFEDKLLTLQAKLGIFGKAMGRDAIIMRDLEQHIRALGKSTSYTTSQVTDAAISLAQAGFNADRIVGSLQAVLDLGRGTGYGLDQSAEILANTMATFNLEAVEATMVADQFVRATRLGTIEIDDLRESLKYVSGAVSNLNEELPVALALLIQMSEAGLKASLAGTSLNTALNQISRNAEVLKASYGIDIVRGIGKDGKAKIDLLKTFVNISRQLQSIQDPAARLAAYNDIFNLRGQRAATSVKEMDRVIKFLGEVRDAAGEARKAAETMDMRMGGALRRATGAISDLAITIGQIFSPLATSFLEAVPAAAQAIQNFALANRELVVTLVALPFALVGVGVALKVVSASMAVAASSLTPLIHGLRGLARIILPGTGKQLSFLFGTKKAPSIFGQAGGVLGQVGKDFSTKKTMLTEAASRRSMANRFTREAIFARTMAKIYAARGLASRAASATRRAGTMGRLAADNLFKANNLTKSAASIRPILTLARGFLSLANALRRFVFSAGGVTTILEIILLFGDKIPAVRQALDSFSQGLSAAYEKIAKIGSMLGPGMTLFSGGISLLNAGNIDGGLGFLQEGIRSIVGVIYNQLLAAWYVFMEKVSWVYDIFRKIAVVAYTIGDTIMKSVGVAIDLVTSNIALLGDLLPNMGAGTLAKDMLTAVLQLAVSVVPAFFSAIAYLDKVFSEALLLWNQSNQWLLANLAKVLPGGSFAKISDSITPINTMLEQRIANDKAALNSLKKIWADAANKVAEAMNTETNVDFKAAKEAAERGAREAQTEAANLLAFLNEALQQIEIDKMLAEEAARQKKAAIPGSTPQVLAEALKVVSSFVGSAQSSRGNLLYAINKEKEAQEAIKENTKIAAEELAEMNRRGGQLVFTS